MRCPLPFPPFSYQCRYVIYLWADPWPPIVWATSAPPGGGGGADCHNNNYLNACNHSCTTVTFPLLLPPSIVLSARALRSSVCAAQQGYRKVCARTYWIGLSLWAHIRKYL